jgi:DNA-dependent protein kinase catalytic subunit
VFDVMNKSVFNEAGCSIRNLRIKTFHVIPITNRLGMLEWVDNTEPLKSVII